LAFFIRDGKRPRRIVSGAPDLPRRAAFGPWRDARTARSR